jgi:hypothetical protein
MGLPDLPAIRLSTGGRKVKGAFGGKLCKSNHGLTRILTDLHCFFTTEGAKKHEGFFATDCADYADSVSRRGILAAFISRYSYL